MSGAGLHATCTWVLKNSEGLFKSLRVPSNDLADFLQTAFFILLKCWALRLIFEGFLVFNFSSDIIFEF